MTEDDPMTASQTQARLERVICYADGASRGNPGPASIGGIVLDEQGITLQTVSRRIGRATNNEAEWQAAIAVLEAAIGLGATTVELRMDSELVVRQIIGRYQVRNPKLIPHHRRVLALLPSFAGYDVRHVPRAQNAAADRLANLALDRPPE